MSSRPVDSSDLSAGIGFLICGFIFVTKFMCALVSFVALLLTILAIVAWNRRVQIGSIVLEPYEARAFILRGLAGAVLVPLFMIFAGVFFGIDFNWHAYGLYLVVGGYIGGSVGIDIMNADEEKTAPVIAVPPPSITPALPPPALPDMSNFRFADWDDEEKRG